MMLNKAVPSTRAEEVTGRLPVRFLEKVFFFPTLRMLSLFLPAASDGCAHLSAINSSLPPAPHNSLQSAITPRLINLRLLQTLPTGKSTISLQVSPHFFFTPDLHRIHHRCSLFGRQLAQQPKTRSVSRGKGIAVKDTLASREMQWICIKTSSWSEIPFESCRM